MDHGAAHDLQQPHFNRALLTRSQLRWIYFLSLGTFWFLRRSAFAKHFVTNAALTVDGPGGTVEIPFHQVAEVRFYGLPLLGGWFSLTLQNGKRYYLTSFIERVDYVLDAIAIAQPTLVVSEKLEKFRRNAIVADHFYARMENSFANWSMLFAMQAALPLAITLAMGAKLAGDGFLNWTGAVDVLLIYISVVIISGIVSLAVWGSAEMFLMLQKSGELIANPLNPLRDLKWERRIKISTHLVHAILATVLAFAMWI